MRAQVCDADQLECGQEAADDEQEEFRKQLFFGGDEDELDEEVYGNENVDE